MQFYCESLTQYKRLKTREVKIGDLLLGNPGGYRGHPVRVQTMTTTDTMDTKATVEQSIRCIEAGSELIRITAPSKREAENLLNIKNELRKRGYSTPIVADIHFTPNAAEIAARIVEKVRVNPGNYIDKKKFEIIEYSDAEYLEEIDRIRERFTPLIKICKEYGTAMRIGTNHGSLSDRIMSRYGDTPMGMVESAMEFLRIARDENYHQIVLSMKSSNPQVMVQAYRLLVKTMFEEFGECYPLHLGVTEAGDGEDGRIKSAIGIGTLLEDGLGDTIRVSLTEDPEYEIPVCKNILKRYEHRELFTGDMSGETIPSIEKISYDPFSYKRRETFTVSNIGGHNVPVVIADLSKKEKITQGDLKNIGYSYDADLDKWNISEAAADYIFTAGQEIDFPLPGTLKVLVNHETWININDKDKYLPALNADEYIDDTKLKSSQINFVLVDCFSTGYSQPALPVLFEKLKNDQTAVVCFSSANKNAVQSIRRMFAELENKQVKNPAIITCNSSNNNMDESLVHYSIETGALFLEGMGDGIWLSMATEAYSEEQTRNKRQETSIEQFINNTSFSILQATRTRISKTEYISCPSCGRTLFDLQETTAKIRAVTNHLKGVKIAIMGCIVNGPGEMADADFGYVGSGPGRITLYKGKEIVKRNVKSEIAVEELINLLKENGAWVEPKELSLL
jgi:(E)-4-hydroxy-3-methylbut-2-enyl-diphosphate synthase